jgi:hypothetical protein
MGSLFHSHHVGSIRDMFSVEKIKVAPEMDEFFEEQTLRNESAGWLRNELLGVGDICILCDDVHDGNGLASLELLSALRQRVLRYDESSEGDSDMEIVVRCVYLKDNGAGFLVRLSYRKLERRYKLEMYVTSTAMRMGGELMVVATTPSYLMLKITKRVLRTLGMVHSHSSTKIPTCHSACCYFCRKSGDGSEIQET